MLKKTKMRLICALLTTATPFQIQAIECKVFKDTNDLISIGQVPLGSVKNLLPKNVAKTKYCYEDTANNYFDCEYIDKFGARYLVASDVVIRTEIKNLTLNKKKLIAHVKNGDSLVDVIKKLEGLPHGFPQWSIGPNKSGKGFIVGTDTCIQASNGSLFSYYFRFNEAGFLTGVGSQLLWN